MKKSYRFLHTCLPFILLIAFVPNANGQLLKKIKKSAERAAERTVERKVERETEKQMDAALDSILEPGTAGTEDQGIPDPKTNIPSDPKPQGDDTASGDTAGTSGDSAGSESLKVYTNFDYVAGDRLLFYEDFSEDYIGDFPSKWNTNGSGEVVTINNDPQKWLKLLQGYEILYIPDVPKLPEDYTIEFDLLTKGIDGETSSAANLAVTISNDPGFEAGSQYIWTYLPIGQYGVFDIRVRNHGAVAGNEIYSGIKADIREAVLNKPHISIAVNGQRFRLWINETKYVDIPKFIPVGGQLTTLKFNLNGLKDGKEDVFITNLKVAEGGVDLRRKLLSEGSVSTNGILFDSGSANIQPRSMGIIRQISQVLQQEGVMQLKIDGHTDSDGSEEANLSLSQKRAEAVKEALVKVYNIDAGRLSAEGKGESEPVGDNGTPDGKAQNRRVVFIKI